MDTTSERAAERVQPSTPKAYVLGLIIGIILFVSALLIAHKHQLIGLNATLFHDVNNLPNFFKVPALAITEGLGAAYPIALCVLLPLCFKRFRLAWRFFVVAAGTGVAMEIAKLIAKEPRPVALLHNNLHVRANESGLTSFPSGHEAIATALALTLWLILPRRWRWVSILWIAIVGVSRVYLGVHSFVDIIGGFAIGLIAVSILQLLPKVIAKPLHLDESDRLLDRGF